VSQAAGIVLENAEVVNGVNNRRKQRTSRDPRSLLKGELSTTVR